MKIVQRRDIYFISEQHGDVENEFKATLCTNFRKLTRPFRAYLVRVKYGLNCSDLNVALCFYVEECESEQLLQVSIKVFKSMFGANEHLDIIFLNEAQESELRNVCCPFFINLNYQVKKPDFYLKFSEGYHLDLPVACFKRRRLYGSHPDGYILCDIGQELEFLEKINAESALQLILASRHSNYSLSPIIEWPAYVHVALPLVNLNDKYLINEGDVKLIAWGELYKQVS